MNAPDYFSFPRDWNAQDLADAVPRRLRLSRMIDFDALRGGAAANATVPARASRPRYLPDAQPPRLFRIR